ncbi:DUF3604 domain-containing protein [Ruegeria sp. R14_0]|uniref:DUF3604 domain-containing protein n=1 Tax=Ruegeria sp. R14_0 TaxID=2821100 RepID=UPI001ADB6138|nr:DUF3604 domain-containing protein [Ruegeria sp. R14_0]MBO9446892.1 DUF3604 domain-containing protein [Ruegeria sp. R14_0]
MRSLLIIALGLVCGTTVYAQDTPPVGPAETYSPYPEQNFPNQVFFGDTHLHTTYSADAGLFGNTLGPDEAYRFAKGETVTSSTGLRARLARPLDFLVVADHAENIGTAPLLAARDPRLLETEYGSSLLEALDADDLPRAWEIFSVTKASGEDPLADIPGIYDSVWQEMTAAAERHNQPGGFTAFIGFEWSSTFDRSNLHRNVIYRGGKENADTRLPFSQYDSANPEDLWDWMEAYEADTGDKLLAIPHNGNLSNGLMFDSVKLGSDEPLDAAYAERRARWEPLYEVTQMKGDGEAHPMLSPDDAFADFETWDKGQLGPNPKTPEMIPNEYAREALKRGLAYRTELGINPFKFGMIGSTDSHTSLATSREDNHFGKVVALEPTADPIRFEEVVGGVGGDESVAQYAWQTSASGLAAVWARENTREALFDAMMRKEVYATTGTRLRVRVFAGYEFEESDLPRSDFAAHGYANGVPMGGDLGKSEGRAPRFLVRALRDPDGANLDRVQIIKGWLNADGSTSEQVYDISCGGREVIDGVCDGMVGNTVNAQEATYTNDIGQAILGGFWVDPDFDPAQSAFYYVRVLEIPTPRWTTYDRKFFGVELPEGAPKAIQDRAYTSPIWYAP